MADNVAQQPQAFPLPYEEIERLVKSLYEPGQAKKISETEATLVLLQRSPQGWQIADALLKSDNEQVRFFGALTLTVKLNADSAELDEENSAQLLSTLIHHLVSRPTSSIATRKVSSTLAQYFTKPISVWTQCIRSLAVSFAVQQPVLDDALEGHPSTWDLFPQLSDEQLLTMLDFAMSLADESKKPSKIGDRKPHERMIANVESLEALLHVSFGRGIKQLSLSIDDPTYAQSVQQGDKICAAALKCFTGWVFYAQSEFKDLPEKLQHLRSVNELALTCLEYNVEDAIEIVAEVLENAFFDAKHQEMLWSAISGPWGLEILKKLDAETVSLARIIVAYGQILLDSKTFYRQPENAHYQQVLSFLHDLLKYPGPPVGFEDEVAPVVLDFWSYYVSIISEENFLYAAGEQLPAWMDNAKANVLQAISELVQKIIYPPADITASWNSDFRKSFKVFRVDVRDIILDAYDPLREVLTDQFIELASRGLEASSWLELEAGLFGLISIAEALTETSDARLVRLFEQPLFVTISGNTGVPAITRRTAVELVAALNHFFLRNPRFLPQVLPFLLTALAQPAIAHGAAKSFASLCSECRKSLTGELASFFQMYEQFLTYQTAEEFTKSMVLKGIAAIVQAQDTEEQQLEGVRHLFQYITRDAMQAINITKEGGDAEQGQVLALTTLKCLSSIGKALQASDEEVIDLESDEEEPSTFWLQGPGKEIQNQIINLVNYMTQVFSGNEEIIETACNVLRTGFKETVAGPFVLPPSAAVDFITKTTVQTPRLPFVLETACCWMASHKHNQPKDFQNQAQRLLQHDLSIMQALQHPRNDPEIAVGCIELIQDLINADPRIMTQESPDNLSGMFGFTVESIKSPEVLPKRAAAKFWKNVFELAGNSHSPHQATIQEIVAHFGPAVAFALVSNVCGEVDFTSLEHIVSPLRAMLRADKNSRAYLTNSLAEQPLLQRFQQDEGVQDMVRKLIESMFRNAKNGTAFKDTVKAFWQSCKQLQMQLQPQTMNPAHRFAHGFSQPNAY
ncbi:hypothetical protein BDW02DRAFT_564370 [Decorospora gaudefroyi]|uniref:ARM repeat-containing protein n=1 Tax=Decorospora gaudefroyi TaxID=184978 RepID=A0A6A5KKT5_9PLEO|nr:hypothetical protein BDW02DRAFT_564370 [Decorospora gaudefroyi]